MISSYLYILFSLSTTKMSVLQISEVAVPLFLLLLMLFNFFIFLSLVCVPNHF